MKKPIQISIPQPCHENWAAMTPSDKGRFCASCQKNVIDFTKASDREIAESLKLGGNLCGRFRKDQLERNLVIPKEKSSLWAAASAAVISFLTIGNNEVKAQTPVKTEQGEKKTEDLKVINDKKQLFTLKGVVKDTEGDILPNARVGIMKTKEVIPVTSDGSYSIEVNIGDIIGFSCDGHIYQLFVVTGEIKSYEVCLEAIEPVIATGAVIIKKE
jgi:hypothetical protein